MISKKHSFSIFTLLAFIFSSQLLFAQQSKTDSLKLVRQKVIEDTKKVQQKRIDSLTTIRKYRQSKHYQDSILNSRNAILNKIQAARKNVADSIRLSRKHILDSSTALRKANTELLQKRLKTKSDSIAGIRKYKESKHYIDSVNKARNRHIDSIRISRVRVFDSLKLARKKSLDSTIAIRKKATDQIQKKQKAKADSLASIRRYKESKRYRDSVQVTRQSKIDSTNIVRKRISDNLIAKRKASIDSMTKLRKARMEALTKLRKQKIDSLKTAQEKRTEALAKKKEQREKELKAERKRKEEKMKLVFELKIKKKHDAWSNEKMLKKKWTLIRQGFQNTYTRYNYYFNARRKMQEANLNMQRRKKDNFEKNMDLFPFDPNVDSTIFASDMDSIIRKASVGIQVHDPRTKWADDLYLLMGQSYYYKGDYERAKTTFKYIIGMDLQTKKKKKKSQTNKENSGQIVQREKSRISKIFQHQTAHNDAILWLTRTDVDSKKEAEAEAILDLMDASAKLSENMKNKIALEKANLYVKKNDYKEASKHLSIVSNSKNASKFVRQRASFLNGQILFAMGLYDSSAKNYSKTLELHPPIEMDFYARKNRADAVAHTGGDQSKSISSLKKLLKDGKYAPYYEQVYYILGKLSANANNNEEALTYYQKSLIQPKTTKKQKAITFASMGNIQYKTGKYSLAKKSYDSASYFAKNLEDNEEIRLALNRGKSLDKIEEPYNTIQNQDSLLKLAAMSEKEQKSVIKKYLKYLEKQKEDSAANALAAASAGSLGAAGSSTPGTGNWYFSSTVAVQQGYNEFKRKWGNRPLTDNWRRASSSSFGAEQNNNATDSSDNDNNSNNEINEQSLFAAIPKTEAQINAVSKKLRRAYVNLGAAYIKDVEEFKEGLATLDTLDKRFPDHEYPDEVLYLKYTAALRQGNLELAEKIRVDLITNHPNSNFAKILNAENISDSTNSSPKESISEYYENTYQLASDRQYSEVIKRVTIAKRIYGDVTYSRKFRVLEALSLASTGEYKKADTVLNQYIKEYPSDSLRPWIDAILKNVAEQKAADTVKNDSSSNSKLSIKAIVDSTIKTKVDTGTIAQPTISDQYTYNPKSNHYCVFVFGKPDAKTAGFRSGLSDFSTIKFSGITLTTEIEMLNAEQSIVVSKAFGSAGQAKIFMNAAKNEKLLFRELEANSYQYFIISEQNFQKLKADKKLEQYLNFYKKNYK